MRCCNARRTECRSGVSSHQARSILQARSQPGKGFSGAHFYCGEGMARSLLGPLPDTEGEIPGKRSSSQRLVAKDTTRTGTIGPFQQRSLSDRAWGNMDSSLCCLKARRLPAPAKRGVKGPSLLRRPMPDPAHAHEGDTSTADIRIHISSARPSRFSPRGSQETEEDAGVRPLPIPALAGIPVDPWRRRVVVVFKLHFHQQFGCG
jgi:hypothetical protein